MERLWCTGEGTSYCANLVASVGIFRLVSNRGVPQMSQEEISAGTDELTDAVQSVVETFQPYRADHRPDCAEIERWLIWNDETSERLGIVALDGPQEHALSLREKKALLRSRAMDLLRNAA